MAVSRPPQGLPVVAFDENVGNGKIRFVDEVEQNHLGEFGLALGIEIDFCPCRYMLLHVRAERTVHGFPDAADADGRVLPMGLLNS